MISINSIAFRHSNNFLLISINSQITTTLIRLLLHMLIELLKKQRLPYLGPSSCTTQKCVLSFPLFSFSFWSKSKLFECGFTRAYQFFRQAIIIDKTDFRARLRKWILTTVLYALTLIDVHSMMFLWHKKKKRDWVLPVLLKGNDWCNNKVGIKKRKRERIDNHNKQHI